MLTSPAYSIHSTTDGPDVDPLNSRMSLRSNFLFVIFLLTSGGVTVSKLDKQTYTSEFESHWASHSFDLVPHRRKELCKLSEVDTSDRFHNALSLFVSLSLSCLSVCLSLLRIVVVKLISTNQKKMFPLCTISANKKWLHFVQSGHFSRMWCTFILKNLHTPLSLIHLTGDSVLS